MAYLLKYLVALTLFSLAVCQTDPNNIPAFCALRTSDIVAGVNKTHVTFDYILSNNGMFNAETHIVTTPIHGSYYTSMSAGVLPGEPVSMFLENAVDGTRYMGLVNTNVINDGISMASRGLFRSVLANQQLRMAIDPNTDVHASPANRLTGWTAFMYEEVARTYCAASAVRSTIQDGFEDPLFFDFTTLNLGPGFQYEQPYNMSTSIFKACLPGYYFIHLTAGVMPQREVRMYVVDVANPNVPLAGLTHNAVSTTGYDTTSRSFMLSMTTNQEIKVINSYGSALYADQGWQTSVSFLGYGNGVNQDVVCFSAARDRSWESLVTLAPFRPFEVVYVNTNNSFDATSGIFTAPLNGSYFVSFSAGSDQQKRVGLSLYKSGAFIAKLERTSTTNIGQTTLSRDVIVDLKPGDTLHLEAQAGTAIFSDPDSLHTSFTVMRLKLVTLIGPSQ